MQPHESNGRVRLYTGETAEQDQKSNRLATISKIAGGGLVAIGTLLTADYALQEEGATRNVVRSMRNDYLDTFGDVDAETQMWRPKLFDQTMKVVMASEIFSAEQKAAFEKRYREANGDEAEMMKLQSDIRSVAVDFAAQEEKKHLPDYFINNDIHVKEWKAAEAIVHQQYPEVRSLVLLDNAVDSFSYVERPQPKNTPRPFVTFEHKLSVSVTASEDALESSRQLEETQK